MSLPRISWHIGDYLKDTGHLRAVGHGAYFMLCLHYYANGKLPESDRELAAIARLSDKEWRDNKPTLQAFFHDGWRHKRIDKEIAEANAKYEARAAAGKRGGEAKANGKQKPSNARILLDGAGSNAQATDNLEPSSEAKASSLSFSEDSLGLEEPQREQATGRKRKNKTPLPENFAPDREFARKLGWSGRRIDEQIRAFFDSALAHNRQYADWQAAWRNWCTSPFQKPVEANGHAPNPDDQKAVWKMQWDFWLKHHRWTGSGPDPESAACHIPQELREEWSKQQ